MATGQDRISGGARRTTRANHRHTLMGRRIALLLLIATAGIAAPGAALGETIFQSPTGNIACAYLNARENPRNGAMVSCATRNDALSMVLAADGRRARGDVSEVIDGLEGGRTLRYGYYLALGPFRCDSTSSGITCVVRRTGRGFFISRATWRWVR